MIRIFQKVFWNHTGSAIYYLFIYNPPEKIQKVHTWSENSESKKKWRIGVET